MFKAYPTENQLAKGGTMTQLVLTIALIFIVYFIGYIVGRNEVVKDIRRMTKELKAK